MKEMKKPEIDIASLLESLNIGFYTSELDKFASKDHGMQEYLSPIAKISNPYSSLYTFRFSRANVCYYKLPRAASTSILEAFMMLKQPDLTTRMSKALLNEERNLYYSYLHQASKAYLAKDPVQAVLNSNFFFTVLRDAPERLASSIMQKIVIPYVNSDQYEQYIVDALNCFTSEDARKKLGDTTLQELVIFALNIEDEHFRNVKPANIDNLKTYKLNNLSDLQKDMSDLLDLQFPLNKINSSSIPATLSGLRPVEDSTAQASPNPAEVIRLSDVDKCGIAAVKTLIANITPRFT